MNYLRNQLVNTLVSDHADFIEARLSRLEVRVSRLVELMDRRDERLRQQRDRELAAIAELRERFDSGVPESGY